MAPTHEEIRDLLPAYALGALPADEVAVLEAHLRGCDECSRESDELMAASAALADSVEPVPLPAGFAERVLEEIGTKPAAQRRRGWIPRLAAAGAVAFVVLFGLFFIDLRNDNQRKQEVQAVLARDTGIALSGDGEVVARVVPNGVASLFAVSGLPEAPAGRTYQLWLMDNGSPVSAGVFDTDGGVALVQVAQPIEDYGGAAVTIEREGGVEAPTTEPILQS